MNAVYVGPDPEAGISAAVVRGGGCLVGPLVGERAVALLLAGVHRLPEHARTSEWTRMRGGTVAGKTILIVGTGGIGRSAARYLGALGARCIGVSASGMPCQGFDEVHPVSSWPAVCESADHLLLAAPLTGSTRGMVGVEALAALPRHAIVINVGRGEVLDTAALVEALGQDKIAGAGLDVTSPEPLPPTHPLWADERVLISSHTADPRSENGTFLAARVEENMRRWLTGKPLLGLIDVRRGY